MRRLGYPFRFVELAAEINDRMPNYVASRIADLLNDVHKSVGGSRILVLGLAYKRDLGDLRESPAPVLIRRLESRGAWSAGTTRTSACRRSRTRRPRRSRAS